MLGDEPLLVTYGDGVSDIDITKLLEFHRAHGKLATVTAVRPPARFGELLFDGDLVSKFTEKPQIHEGWINGGFFVLEPGVFDYLHEKECSLEVDTLERLAADGQLGAYKHQDFWQCMDTLRDKRLLETLWDSDAGAVEGVGVSTFWRDRPTLLTGGTGLVGGWLRSDSSSRARPSCASCATGCRAACSSRAISRAR